MTQPPAAAIHAWQGCQYPLSSARGHYESYFVRANDPSSPRALWLRYTLFRPEGRPELAIGEVWALYFDGGQHQVKGVRAAFPMQACHFERDYAAIQIGDATLDNQHASGEASDGSQTLSWQLTWSPRDNGLLLLPEALYATSLPKAKSLVLATHLRLSGELVVNGEPIKVQNWVGTLNHNWGRQHTDAYAWGQVCGFDNAPDAFLECATAQIRVGPAWTPKLTPVVLRLDGQTHALNGLGTAVRAKARYKPFRWTWHTGNADLSIEGALQAPQSFFAALHYGNPPGGNKVCLNTKLAFCELLVRRRGQAPRRLISEHGAAFEILTDDLPAGMRALNAPVNAV